MLGIFRPPGFRLQNQPNAPQLLRLGPALARRRRALETVGVHACIGKVSDTIHFEGFLLTKHQNQEGLTTTNLNLQNKNPLELDIHASYRRKAPAIVDAKLLFAATKV